MKSVNRTISRRSFLVAAGAGSAAVTAGLVARSSRNRQPPGATRASASAGYHVTEHIRNYYRTAKV
jgi:hypothetical protein